MEPTKRYSEAFKLHFLRELERGRFASLSAAARTYGISIGTIHYWANKYGKLHLLGKVIRVETPKELNETKELRKRVKQLESALADAHLGQKFAEAYLRIACRTAGIEDVDGFKKKHAPRL
jgi:transposase-like protein